MERYVAFDIGDKRIGVAISDPFNTYALPSHTYFRKGFKEDVSALAQIAKEKGATVIICGLPVNFDGSEALQTQKTARFIEALKSAVSVPVVCEDERFTTKMAHETLISEGMSREKRKNYVDALAAANILDGYLNKLKEEKKMGKKDLELEEEFLNGAEDADYEEDDDIIELEDEDGKVLKCVVLDVIKYKGERYEVLMPAEPNESVAEDEVVIFRLNEEEAVLESVEDEEVLEEVFKLFQQGEYEDGEDEETVN